MLRDTNNADILTLTFMGCLLLIALSKLLFPKRFNEFTSLLFNSRYTSLYARDQRFFDAFEGLLFLNLTLNLGLSLYIYLSFINSNSIYQLQLFKYSIYIGSFLALKIAFEKILSNVLDLESIVDKYIFQKISIRNFIGLLLLPVNAFLVYTIKLNQISFSILAIILFLILVFGLSLFIKNNLNVFKKSLFYFILYLCALEIAPYVILYKMITTH